MTRIIDAAIAELDAAGVERLTMRKLAERLEVTSTALYWHVATKEDLLDLALDHVVGEVPVPAPDGRPRAGLRALLMDWRAAMLAHPWSPGRSRGSCSMADATWRRLDDPAAIAKVRAHILDSAERYPTLSTSGFVDAGWSDAERFAFGLDRVPDRLLTTS
ncbi:TetR/AcrR family transcriptional regulator [Amycolatopsis sp. NPDC058278]|uniref:TetR/AcrR family transcriptional regulator n=1 Tax=Amycolatopsis sp. NPDC058278 TaxID=3346417 RepID=UPI0036DC5F44